VSVSSFVPKPHTPFEWRPQDSAEEIERKQNLLKSSLKSRDVSLSWHDARTSSLEGVLARGDRRLGKAIYLAWKQGCRFDAWSEHFRYDIWMDSIREAGLTPEFYANRRREYGETLPWDHINSGVTKEFLIKEDKKAEEGAVTQDCRLGGCTGCGVKSILPKDCCKGVPGIACTS
jgi:radical SAM superfamily enzyme YgiQ (UPF0313 family)